MDESTGSTATLDTPVGVDNAKRRGKGLKVRLLIYFALAWLPWVLHLSFTILGSAYQYPRNACTDVAHSRSDEEFRRTCKLNWGFIVLMPLVLTIPSFAVVTALGEGARWIRGR